jgi:KDO2-lipid IV(A) lauroyltransferase
MAEASTGKRLRGSPLRGIVHRIEGAAARVFFGAFRLLPLDAASALGGWLGRLIGPRLGVNKRAMINLKRALPALDDTAAGRVLTGMWDNLGRVIAEYPHLDKFDLYGSGGRAEVIGTEHWEGLAASGTPIVFISAHFGNWEVATMAATQRGLGIAEIYRAANNPFVDDLIAGFRSPIGSELVPKGVVAARRAIAALKEGRHLAMLVDQKMNDGIAVPFFGRDAMTAPAAAQLALRFNGAIIPARVERTRGARFRIVFSPPVELSRSADRHADLQAIMTRVNAEMESWIRARPEMWLWVHRRWPD